MRTFTLTSNAPLSYKIFVLDENNQKVFALSYAARTSIKNESLLIDNMNSGLTERKLSVLTSEEENSLKLLVKDL
jgi:hypothetical protein